MKLRMGLFGLVALACAKPETPPADSSAAVAAAAVPNVVTITAMDFAFQAPDTIPSGVTTLQLVNAGPEIHHAQLLRLGDGKTFADLTAALKTMQPGTPPPPWITEEGGPNPPEPGDTSWVTQDLQPGNYALICFVDTPDKVPHMAKGMLRPLVVVPNTGAAVPAPVSDVSVVMKDYAWDITPALTAGEHMLKVENIAQQPHEFFLIKLDEGKTPEDFGKWAATYKGPAPGKAMGGIASMRPGAVAYVKASLVPGNYMMICFVPDAKDGKPHLDHGMVYPFTVS
ncbi:MAG: hypothetical protein ACT4P7_23995 [Gemmatimonadaceae bacterium]